MASVCLDLLRGLEWVAVHEDAYRIRALNVSASVSFPESYATSPVDAAVEYLWSRGVAVVASAGTAARTRTRCGTRQATTRM